MITQICLEMLYVWEQFSRFLIHRYQGRRYCTNTSCTKRRYNRFTAAAVDLPMTLVLMYPKSVVNPFGQLRLAIKKNPPQGPSRRMFQEQTTFKNHFEQQKSSTLTLVQDSAYCLKNFYAGCQPDTSYNCSKSRVQLMFY